MECEWLWCSAHSLLKDPHYNKELTNALVIQLIPFCQFVLAVILAKKGVATVFPYLHNYQCQLIMVKEHF